MSDVIPPATLYSIHPFGQYTKEQNNLWKQLFLLLDQLYRRTGGTTSDVDKGVDEASANENQISLLLALIEDLKDRIEDLEAQEIVDDNRIDFNSVTVSKDYVANDYDFVNAKQRATIRLPKNPQKNAVVIVRNGDDSRICIHGNGKKINGLSLGQIETQGTALVIHYFIDSDEWLIR